MLKSACWAAFFEARSRLVSVRASSEKSATSPQVEQMRWWWCSVSS